MICNIPTLVEENTRTQILYPMIDKMNYGTFVEVGTYLGGNLIRCALRAKDQGKLIQFYAVDNFKFENVSDHKDYGHDEDGTYFSRFWSNVVEYGVEDYIIAVKEDSTSGLNFFVDDFVDLVFIDGNHNESHVQEDIKNWLTKLKDGGILCGHDYLDPGVKNAVDSIIKIDGHTSCGSSFYFVKE